MATTPNKSAYEAFRSEINGLPCFLAGFPSFPRNFSRDVFIAGIIADDFELLDSQVAFSASHQGEKSDKITGEEHGKIHHEMPGVIVRDPLYTTYNACDTTSFFLMALEQMCVLKPSRKEDLLDTFGSNINSAIAYIEAHILENIFREFPPPPAKEYSLRVTYWKDSVVPNASQKIKTQYPVSYALAHFQAARAIQSAYALTGNEKYKIESEQMFEVGISTFIRRNSFIAYIDNQGEYPIDSSDELHSLFYIPTTLKSMLPIEQIVKRSKQLETKAGFACVPLEISNAMSDNYHGHVVWPFEQALIHKAAIRFEMTSIALIAQRCAPLIKNGFEVLYVDENIRPRSNDRQLWSVAALTYFNIHSISRLEK